MALEIRSSPAAANHFERGRRGHRVHLLVIHVEEGTERGTAALFADPNAAHPTSAHYGISKEGVIARFVDDEDTAWQAGNQDVNWTSIGIELEGFVATFNPPDAQLDALVALCRQLCAAHGIPIDRQHIIGHDEVPDPRDPKKLGGRGHHVDPGPLFPWSRFMAAMVAPEVAPTGDPLFLT